MPTLFRGPTAPKWGSPLLMPTVYVLNSCRHIHLICIMFYRLLTMNKGNLIYILSYRLFQTSPKFRTPGGGYFRACKGAEVTNIHTDNYDRISSKRQCCLFSVSISACCLLLYCDWSKVISDYRFETVVRVTSKHTGNANELGTYMHCQHYANSAHVLCLGRP